MFSRCSTMAALALMAMLVTPADAQAPDSGRRQACCAASSIRALALSLPATSRWSATLPRTGRTRRRHIRRAQHGRARHRHQQPAASLAGLCMRRRLAYPLVRLPANMSAPQVISASLLGVGTNILIGGSGRTFALQPVSLEGSVAVNVALGVSGLKLKPAY